jgi:hypothetical protein
MQVTTLSTNWTSSLNRFAIGLLALYFVGQSGLMPVFSTESFQVDLERINVASLAWLLSILVGSQFLGMMIVPLGRPMIFNKGLRESARIKRSKIIGESGNVLLIELCRDAHAKAEVASGVMGLLAFALLLGLTSWITSLVVGNDIELLVEHSGSNNELSIVWGFAGIVTGWWLKHSVNETLVELDRVCGPHTELDEHP